MLLLISILVSNDDNTSEKYPYRVTWYAEHAEESTLSFFSTNPFENMIGPGVAKAKYGGCALIFPPKHIPDIWQNYHPENKVSLQDHLVKQNMKYSDEKFIAYVAAKPPSLKIKNAARKQRKHLIFIPLNSFSSQEINRLRKFHVLNGHQIRSYAADFIQE